MQNNHVPIYQDPPSDMMAVFKSILVSIAVMLPSVLAGIYLMGHGVAPQYAYYAACAVVLLMALDLAIVIALEKFHSKLGTLTLPAFAGTIVVIFLYIVTESFNRFFDQLGYEFLTPLSVVAVLFTGAAIFLEKNVPLKSQLGINSIALLLLWAMGASDKITMPF